MKKIFGTALIATIAVTAATTAQAQKHHTLPPAEVRQGWQLLFDGSNIEGWRKPNSTEMASNWIVDTDYQAMKVKRGERAGRGSDGDILFGERKFSNFELSIDWMIEPEGNSGIFYNITEFPNRPIYIACPEVQVLDNWRAGDNKLTNHLAGSLYDMLPALPQNARPAMEWNTIVITVDNGYVTHVQNGVQVCAYTLWSPEWDALVAKSKFKDWPEFMAGVAREGYIGLQDHGYNCWFRNIKIREIK
jgi:hypothetical protein